MSDSILTGHQVALRYINFLSLKMQSNDSDVAELAKYIHECTDNVDELRKRYKQLFSKYKIDSEDKKQIVYITEKILEFINK
jgi:hypothetical protein